MSTVLAISLAICCAIYVTLRCSIRVRSRFEFQVGYSNQSIYNFGNWSKNTFIFSYLLPKLWIESTRIGHMLQIKYFKCQSFKKIINSSWSPKSYMEKQLEWFNQFLTMKNTFQNQSFEFFDRVVHNLVVCRWYDLVKILFFP